MPAQLPVPGNAAGLPGAQGVRCPAAGWAERGRGWAPGPRVFTGPQAPGMGRHLLPPSPSRCRACGNVMGAKGSPHPVPAASPRHLVLQDLVGHQLLQEVPMDGVAGLRPAARGGPLERDNACQPGGQQPAAAQTCREVVRWGNPKCRRAREPSLKPSPGVQVRTEPRGGVRWFPKPASTPGPGAQRWSRGDRQLGNAPSCQEMEGDALLPASYPLVGQQELQVTLAPVGIRFRPRLQLVPLVVPAVQVLRAQRQGVKECSHGSNGAGRCCTAHL